MAVASFGAISPSEDGVRGSTASFAPGDPSMSLAVPSETFISHLAKASRYAT